MRSAPRPAIVPGVWQLAQLTLHSPLTRACARPPSPGGGSLVDAVAPGARISVVAISSLFNSGARERLGAAAIRTPYLRVVGIEDATGTGQRAASFTPDEEQKFREASGPPSPTPFQIDHTYSAQFARQPDVYERLVASIAPSISGDYTQDIKRAIACQLMGGSRKVTALSPRWG